MEHEKGVILQENKKIIYIQHGFQFDLIAPNFGEFHEPLLKLLSGHNKNSENKYTIIKPTDGLIFGKTYEGYRLAIYANQEIEILGSQQIFAPLYIKNEEKISSYCHKIDFEGGTLNELAYISTKRTNSSENYSICYDKIEYTYSASLYEQECQIKIYTFPTNTKNSPQIHLSCEFQTSQPLSSIPKFIKLVQTTVQFMTRRKNVGFEHIRLFHKNEKGQSYSKSDFYMHYDSTEWTTKSWNQNITFEDIGDCFPKLITLLQTEEKEQCLFDFIPENDHNYNIIDDDCIKNTCASLEHELSLLQVQNEKNTLLNQIKEELKNVIKNYKDNPNLSSEDYSSLHGQIKNIDYPVKNRIKALYQSFENILSRFTIQLGYIDDFIDYRNNIVHGNLCIRTQTITDTTVKLMALVYCSILRRAGVSDEKITKMVNKHKLIL